MSSETSNGACSQQLPRSPGRFAVDASGGRWWPAPHLILLNDYLIRVAAGEIKRLMVFMPPRHGKSQGISEYFAAWYLGTFPDRRVILTSYEADFAAQWGRKARNLLEATGTTLFREHVEIAGDSSSASRWDIKGRRGGMVTAGVGGPITGKGANLLIIDDPVKNAAEANSKTYRESTWDWYQSTAYTRLEPDGAIILIQTRWHEADLGGRLLDAMKHGGDQWEILELPAIANDNDPLGRPVGAPLCPAWFDAAALDKIRVAVGPYVWSALYQQRPKSPEGALFKRQYFRYFDIDGGSYTLHHPDGVRKFLASQCIVIQTCDPAGSTKTSADYFALGTWAVTPHADLLLLDVIKERLEGPDQPELFTAAHDRWAPVAQGVEPKAVGLTLYQTLLRTGLPIHELKADGDKFTRALPMAARYAAGTVYHRKGAAWLDDYEDELIDFPRGANDDQVDMAAYAAILLEKMMRAPEETADVELNDPELVSLY
jgi:predicted phage terminase large subunit-like protein